MTPREGSELTPSAVRGVLEPFLANSEPPEDWADRLSRYLQLLVERNQRVNLVSRKSIGRILEEQVLPSLAALLVVPPRTRMRVLDVGSGGGLPGIPLAILRPEIRIDLVDATLNKCEFLEAAIAAAALPDARVHWCRIEAPCDSLVARSPFDLALARAAGLSKRAMLASRSLVAADGALWTYVATGTPGSTPWPALNPVTALTRIDP